MKQKLCFQKPDNSTEVTVGTLIALIVAEGENWQDVEVPEDLEVAAAPPAPSGSAGSTAPKKQSVIMEKTVKEEDL